MHDSSQLKKIYIFEENNHDMKISLKKWSDLTTIMARLFMIVRGFLLGISNFLCLDTTKKYVWSEGSKVGYLIGSLSYFTQESIT